MQLPSDEEQVALITRVADGESEALGEFAARMGPWVHAALLQMVRDPEVAESLAERAFLEVWQAAPLWDRHVGRPLLWVLAIARAQALEWIDPARRKGEAGPGTEPPPSAERAAARDEGTAVGGVLASIPAADRELLEAAWFNHPVTADDVALPDAETVGPALQRFARALGGG